MAIVVEDGTGVTGSTSYSSVADADAYFANTPNNSAWSALINDAKEIALNDASMYFDLRWSGKLGGIVVNTEQGLALPRTNLYTRTGVLVEGVPSALVKAVAEYALLSATGKLYRTTSIDNGVIKSTKKKVGPIETSVSYQEWSQNTGEYLTHTKPDAFVKNYFGFVGGASVIRN